MIYLDPGEPNGRIALTRVELHALPTYSMTLPTGQTPGKAWKRRHMDGSWTRGMFGKPYPEGHEFHGQIPINWKPIVVIGQEPAWPRNVRIPRPTMRGLI